MERLKKIGRVQTGNAAEIGPSKLGIGFEKLDRRAFEPEKAYDLVANLGVHYVRIQSGWMRTEQERGVYQFDWLDEIVDALIARGTEPWIDLCYGNPLYTPLARQVYGAVGCAPTGSKEEMSAWLNYVEATVRHFSGRVTWYEIWNEPDGRSCWRPEVDAGDYADFAVATASAIRRADPQAKSIAGVLCSINLPYFKIMFDHGVADAADAVSFHRYNSNELDALGEIRALRALIDQYNPHLGIIQGESGTQTDSRGAGALSGGAWTPAKQAKYLLRHRLLDLSSEVIFTSHFTAVDMVEALNGVVGNQSSYMDYGYFGVIQADFDENGLATGSYRPKPSYLALQNLAALFRARTAPADMPIKRIVKESRRFFGRDESGSRFVSLGFQDDGGRALAYWYAADLLHSTYEGTVSFQLPGETAAPKLVDLLDGSVYALAETMIRRNESGEIVELINLPLADRPLLLAFGRFGGRALDAQ